MSRPPEPAGTFVDRLLAQLPSNRDRAAAVFVRHQAEPGEEQLSCGDLDRGARAIAAALRAEGVHPGDRVLLLHPQGLGFVQSLVGCFYAGAVAVPAPLPDGSAHQRARAAGALHDSGARLVVTERSALVGVSAWSTTLAAPADLLTVEDALTGDPSTWTPPPVGPDNLAFLQYSSGSVGEPKGVMIRHRDLCHNLATIGRALAVRPGDRSGGWLPHYHDMGLVGLILAPLYLGVTTVLMPASDFLRRPVQWLQLLDRHGVTITSAPNFAYDLCTRAVPADVVGQLDLSRLRVAIDGAEPVRASTVAAFTGHLAPAGLAPQAFTPSYGMAEATLFISGTPPDRPPTIRRVDGAALESGRLVVRDDDPDGAPQTPTTQLVSSGSAWELDLRVVHPRTGAVLPEGHVGEIWLRGPGVAAGYWTASGEEGKPFDAATADGESGFLRTGDLGAVWAGDIFVTGRVQEVMIVRGRNIHPHDVEHAARQSDPQFATLVGSAFSVDVDREELVLVQEFRPSAGQHPDLPSLSARLRDTVLREVGVAVSVVLVRPGAVERTTSGKIRRTAMRRSFVEGRLEPLHEDLLHSLSTRLGRSGSEVPA